LLAGPPLDRPLPIAIAMPTAVTAAAMRPDLASLGHVLVGDGSAPGASGSLASSSSRA
jgi:hypothetical protein